MQKKSRTSLALVSASLLLVACGAKGDAALTEGSDMSASSEAMTMEASYTGTKTEVDMETSTLTFVGKSSIVDHPGSFEKFTATVTPSTSDAADFTKAKVEVSIDMTSVSTGIGGLDGHLKSAEFFDAENHPTGTFVSKKIVSVGGDKYEVTGDLTIKGITAEATMDVEITDEMMTVTYEVPRDTFEIGKDSYGEKLLAETVPLEAKVMFK